MNEIGYLLNRMMKNVRTSRDSYENEIETIFQPQAHFQCGALISIHEVNRFHLKR
jgi:hypothetical protein